MAGQFLKFIVLAISVALLVACGSDSSMSVAPSNTIEQSATTEKYTLTLTIGPSEKMLTTEEAKTAKEGEVMIGGDMAMGMSDMSMGQHLEVSVKDRKTGAVVTDKMVAIKVKDDMTKEEMNVTVMMMYGVDKGMADTHFGNNINLMSGDYTIVVTVDSDVAIFHVTISGS